MSPRYYSPDNPESYVTPSKLKRLGREKQIAYMVHWFLGLFEDPVHETPYISREGGYQYIWGGPYNAAEELGSEFGGIVPDGVIEAAVDEVQSEGTFDWAPTSAHPDRMADEGEAMTEHHEEPPPPTLEEIQRRLNDGIVPSFGDPHEWQERQDLRRELAQLRDLLTQEPARHGGIGHNQPPERLALTLELKVEVTQAIDQMDAELIKDTPVVPVIIESAGRLQKILFWIGKKIDKTVDDFMGVIGKAGGVAVAAALAGMPIAEKIGEVLNFTLGSVDILP